LRGEEFRAMASSLPGNSINKTTGIVALKSVDAAMAPVGRAGGLVLVLGVLCLLVALGASVMTARRFLGPLDHVEAGVAEVINGNLDYSFDKSSPDFEGLANALNVMLARLLGRPEPSEDDDGDQMAEKRWKADGMFEDVDTAQAAGGAVADNASLALANESADAYYKRTFDEYVAAKRQVGERTDGVNFDSFRAKLAQNETALKGKYKCRMVRFSVTLKGNQVTLKPVPIY
jgi:nitrogen fixation/metabolism regulation signal transduction histidine kinase